jgi:hypothetical protein
MSTLTALKLEVELEVTRRAMTRRPTLTMQWRIDPASGRPVGIWVASPAAEAEPQTVMAEPAFA